MKKIILSAAFILMLLFCTATVTAQCSVMHVWTDTTTQGDWDFNPVGSPIGVYGSYAHILPLPPYDWVEVPIGPYTVPIGGVPGLPLPPFDWTPSQIAGLADYDPGPAPYLGDEYESLDPPVTYAIGGTLEQTGLPPDPGPTEVQYPAFEWGWGHAPDARAAYYRTIPGYKFAAWDDGGERCHPVHGYIDVTLNFPEGQFLLSLYAYDKEAYDPDGGAYVGGTRDSHEYQVYVGAPDGSPDVSQQISGLTFDDGVYELFIVRAGEGGCTITVRVYNDDGHDPSGAVVPTYNVLLNGIFVDRLGAPGHTIGFWKNNVDKNLEGENAKGKKKDGNAQLTKAEMEAILDAIAVDTCPELGFFVGLTLEEASEIFNNHKKDDLPKAQAQLLALLCSVEYYTGMDADYLLSPIYLPDVGQTGGAFLGTLAGAVQLVLDEYCAENYGVAHALATMLNEME